MNSSTNTIGIGHPDAEEREMKLKKKRNILHIIIQINSWHVWGWNSICSVFFFCCVVSWFLLNLHSTQMNIFIGTPFFSFIRFSVVQLAIWIFCSNLKWIFHVGKMMCNWQSVSYLVDAQWFLSNFCIPCAIQTFYRLCRLWHWFELIANPILFDILWFEKASIFISSGE